MTTKEMERFKQILPKISVRLADKKERLIIKMKELQIFQDNVDIFQTLAEINNFEILEYLKEVLRIEGLEIIVRYIEGKPGQEGDATGSIPENSTASAVNGSDSFCNDLESKNNKRPRTVFTESQLKGLESSWDNGLYNTKDKGSVSTLADNLALTEQQVKDWIGNKRAKLKRSSSGAQILSPKAPLMKGPTAYNVFCTGKSLNYSSSGQTFCNWSNEWKNMKEEEKQKYKEEAVSLKNNIVPSTDRTKLKKHHLKLISQSCDVLSSLGIHVGGLFVDTDGCAGVFGSSSAHGYFCQKSIRETFASQMQASETNIHKETDHREAVNLVRKKFNDCWEKATGNRQVPYKAIKDGKFILDVKNLPSGVKFRDPSCMGLKTLKSIMSVKDIEIIVLSQPSSTPVLGNEGRQTQTETARPEQLENEAIIPSPSGRAESVGAVGKGSVASQLDNEAMIPSLSKDDVDILFDAVGSNEVSESNEVSVKPSTSKIHEVQQILQQRKRGKRKELLVKWKNSDTPTWELEDNLFS